MTTSKILSSLVDRPEWISTLSDEQYAEMKALHDKSEFPLLLSNFTFEEIREFFRRLENE